MKDLFKLLERFTHSLNKDEITRERIASIISNKIGISFNTESISLKNGVLELKGNPALNNEIKLKEESIKNELEGTHNIKVQRVLYK